MGFFCHPLEGTTATASVEMAAIPLNALLLAKGAPYQDGTFSSEKRVESDMPSVSRSAEEANSGTADWW